MKLMLQERNILNKVTHSHLFFYLYIKIFFFKAGYTCMYVYMDDNSN